MAIARTCGEERGLFVRQNEGFEEGLDKNPQDWSLRGIYADWLDENGHLDQAYCQRWMTKWLVSPCFRVVSYFPDYNTDEFWDWQPYNAGRHTKRSKVEGRLPLPIFLCLPRIRAKTDNWMKYATRVDAEEALAQALAKARELLSV